MTTPDSPDYQETVVTVPATGDTTDAPDWQETVVGPGATPIGPGGSGQGAMPGPDQWSFLGWSGYPELGGGAWAGLYNGNAYLAPVSFTASGTVDNGYVIFSLEEGSFNTPCLLCLYEADTAPAVGSLPDLTLVAYSTATAFADAVATGGSGIVPLVASASIDATKFYWGGAIMRSNNSPIFGVGATTTLQANTAVLAFSVHSSASGLSAAPSSLAPSELTYGGSAPWTAWY